MVHVNPSRVQDSDVNPNTFGAKLSHTDKKVRDKAVRTLRQWLVTNYEKTTPLDLLKLWKALFYCFWMSDKNPVQKHLATNLSSLLTHQNVPFLNAFWKIIVREWSGIDYLRLDKFYMLIKQFHQASLVIMLEHPELINQFNTIFTTVGPLQLENLKLSDSITYHTIEHYFTLIDSSPDHDTLMLLLEPFIYLFANSSKENILSKIKQEIFDKFITITEEYEEKTNVFKNLNVNVFANLLFTKASAPDCKGMNRRWMYKVAEDISASTGVDLIETCSEEIPDLVSSTDNMEVDIPAIVQEEAVVERKVTKKTQSKPNSLDTLLELEDDAVMSEEPIEQAVENPSNDKPKSRVSFGENQTLTFQKRLALSTPHIVAEQFQVLKSKIPGPPALKAEEKRGKFALAKDAMKIAQKIRMEVAKRALLKKKATRVKRKNIGKGKKKFGKKRV